MSSLGRRLAITDNNLLVNFVDSGEAQLLGRYCSGPLLIAPSVIEPSETPPFQARPSSEFNAIIYKAQLARRRYEAHRAAGIESPEPDPVLQQRADRRLAFLRQRGTLWEPVELTEDDARHRYTLQHDPALSGMKRRQADAECLALALRRGLILLTDDQPVVQAALHLGVQTRRTCALLIEMAEAGLLSPAQAITLFNDVMVGQLKFYARRKQRGVAGVLKLLPGPLRCEWVPA